MVTTTMPVPAVNPAIFATVTTAARFLGHFLLALISVIFLGSGTEH